MPKVKATRKTKARGAAKKKDPNAPKRPLSAYMFFSVQERPRLREKYPEAGFKEMGEKLGKAWSALSEDNRKPFHDMAKNDKERYEREKAAYDAAQSAEADESE